MSIGGIKGRLILILVALLGLAVYWLSNQKSVGYTDRRQVLVTSVEQENQLGANAYKQILVEEGGNVLCSHDDLHCSENDKLYRDTVREIGAKLRKAAIEYDLELVNQGRLDSPRAANFDWTFNVINSEQPNAFCLPGGYVAVYTQMMDVTGDFDGELSPDDVLDKDMLAVVMGHEIAHALLRHGGERMSQGQIMKVGQMAIGVAADDPRVAQAFGLAAQTGVLLPFSRQHESEADKVGLDLLVRACYDPRKAPELWLRMDELGKKGQRPPEFLSTHPSSTRRAENFERWMPDAIAEYEKRCGPLPAD